MGVPERQESGHTGITVFMQKLLTSALGWDETMQPMETDWTHRAPIPCPNPEERLQTILVRFLHSANTELILCTAQNKSELTWEGNCIMIVPNFSWATQVKRDKFRECKKALREF